MPCTLVHSSATPEALGAEFGERGHVTGTPDAPVTIVAFSDYQCTACAILAKSLKQIRVTHLQDVRLVYVNTPLSSRDKDVPATRAVEAADLQGKFWDLHDLLFEKQAEWTSLTLSDFEKWLVRQAESLGMDAPKFQADFASEEVTKRVDALLQSSSGQAISPPILFVNSSSPYTGLSDFASLDTVVRIEALTKRQFSNCPAWGIDPIRQYVASLHTSAGDATIQLYPDKAPVAVNAFVALARSGWYNGITFYKVIPNAVIMSGDPSETGMGNPGFLFETEIPGSLAFDRAGVVALDNNGPNTNGSRFLITLAPVPEWTGRYTIIGKVLSGLQVLAGLSPRDPQPGESLPEGDRLISVDIQEH
jgi:cyclophilin family peptidyl-prolyl cis-trans isomerase